MPIVSHDSEDIDLGDERINRPGRPTDTASSYTQSRAEFDLNTLRRTLHKAVDISLDKFFSEANRLRREEKGHSVVDSNMYRSHVLQRTPKSVVKAWVDDSAACDIVMEAMTSYGYSTPDFTVNFEYSLSDAGLETRADVSCKADGYVVSPYFWGWHHKWPDLSIEHDYSRLSRCLDRLMHPAKPVKERGNDQDLDVRQTIDKVGKSISDTPIFGKLRDECYTPERNGKALFEIDANDTDREAQSRYTVESNIFPLSEGMSSTVVDMTYRGFVMKGDRTYGSWIKTPGVRLQLQSATWDPEAYNIKNTVIHTQPQDDPL